MIVRLPSLLRVGAFRKTANFPASICGSRLAHHGHHDDEKAMLRTQEQISAWVKNEQEKGWRGYGYSNQDKKEDAFQANCYIIAGIFFFGLTGLFFRFCPDYKLHDWTVREALILLRERELAGIFPIDKNFIDPAKLELPSDEELGDATIIV